MLRAGLLIYFGYPQAHEDDAERAVRAGLGIAAVRGLQARLAPTMAPLRAVPLRVRIGLHTRLAVMGTMGTSAHRRDMAGIGETPHIATGVQSVADPDTVVLTQTTYRLLRDPVVCEALGARPLTGVAAPVSDVPGPSRAGRGGKPRGGDPGQAESPGRS